MTSLTDIYIKPLVFPHKIGATSFTRNEKNIHMANKSHIFLFQTIINPFVTSGTHMSHLQRVFSSPLG
jgi:hypothetical protein